MTHLDSESSTEQSRRAEEQEHEYGVVNHYLGERGKEYLT